MKPFVSVVVPTLNEEKYIEATLRSIKNQDYGGKYEIIVSDSGSKDKTLKIAEKYADEIIRLKKRGVALVRNAGMKAANGEIVLFVDADTIILPNTIREFANAYKKGVVGVTCLIVPNESNITNLILYQLYNMSLLVSLKTKKPKVAGICCSYRKAALEKVGGFNESLHILEDYDLSQRIKKHGKIVIAKNTIALTSTRRLKNWGKLKIAKDYMKFYFGNLVGYRNFNPKDYPDIR